MPRVGAGEGNAHQSMAGESDPSVSLRASTMTSRYARVTLTSRFVINK